MSVFLCDAQMLILEGMSNYHAAYITYLPAYHSSRGTVF